MTQCADSSNEPKQALGVKVLADCEPSLRIPARDQNAIIQPPKAKVLHAFSTETKLTQAEEGEGGRCAHWHSRRVLKQRSYNHLFNSHNSPELWAMTTGIIDPA